MWTLWHETDAGIKAGVRMGQIAHGFDARISKIPHKNEAMSA